MKPNPPTACDQPGPLTTEQAIRTDFSNGDFDIPATVTEVASSSKLIRRIGAHAIKGS